MRWRMMDNSVFKAMNSGMMQKFNQFRQTVQGDPKQQVMELLQSGKMSNEQFQRLQQQANQFQQMFNIK